MIYLSYFLLSFFLILNPRCLFASSQVDALIQKLKSEDVSVRQEAIVALGEIRDSRAAEALIGVLKDEDWRLTEDALAALEKIGPSAINPLAVALKDKNINARRGAVVALGKIKDVRVVDLLIDALNDEDEVVQTEAVNALRGVKNPRVDEALSKVEARKTQIAETKKAQEKIHNFVFGALIVFIGGALIVFFILGPGALIFSGLRSIEKRFSIIADLVRALLWLFGLLGQPKIQAFLIRRLEAKRDVNGLIKALAYSNVRMEVVSALLKMGENSALVNALESSNTFGLTGENTIDILLSILKYNSGKGLTGQVVDPVVAALMKAVSKRDVDRLVGDLNHPTNGPLRYAAVMCLAEIGDPRAVEPLIAHLNNKNQRTMYSVVALGRLKDSRAVDPLVGLLKDPDPDFRERSAYALGEIGDARSIEPLVAALRDEFPDVREVAARALASLGWSPSDANQRALHAYAIKDWKALVAEGAVATDLLLKMLKGTNSNHRLVAIRALGKVGDQRVVDPLVSALKDQEFSLRQEAAKALKGLGPKAEQARADFLESCKITMDDQEMVDILTKLCNAYANNDRFSVSTLEPQATMIGQMLNRSGGIAGMLRIFSMLPNIQGKRTLEMHWGGIGEWRG